MSSPKTPSNGLPAKPPVQSELRARELCFAYGSQQVLHNVTLELGRGELLGLAGPNGAGKSTLLMLLTGYLHPQGGRVELAGRDITAMGRREVATHIAFVPQKSDTAFSFSVREMVLMGRQPYAGLATLDSAEDLEIVEQALADAGISNLAHKGYDQLSGGEQQLVLLARALAQKTPILVLDEPASFLDIRRQWEMLNLLEKLRAQGMAVLATFHDLNQAARWCTRLALMQQGRLVACASPNEVLTPALLQQVYGIGLRVETTPQGLVRVDYPGTGKV